MSISKDISLSLEIFPPNSLEELIRLDGKCKQLAQLNPDFFSVTFGASGSSQWRTQHLVQHLVKNNICTVPHMACIHMTKQEISKILREYHIDSIKFIK